MGRALDSRFMVMILITLIAMTKYITEATQGTVVWLPVSGQVQWHEYEAAGHLASTFWKEAEMKTCVQPASCFLSLRLQPVA